ncbi:LysR-family transcriptional regulator [Pectobacterium atrosepticum SCRI1043]|uniref:LysR-family transcriptional regulator n=1 Tax=Pectobacterium atrosepticum (strain SCRI 1043 / ATCC BAA-672) TaxID=218491 RepID=Q6D322_PECAS|nr:LysR family transcriptional regulator [Pectobacterium atrosepticum]AIA71749.1 LysR family transcriptional regulator [Pectobacterium atrosepticum]AIK14706.1 Murein peptide degradation regulator [Pectobacterium atrosepticum]MCL6315098.1 LysR family transcriptional regulator [Pectobacterium atrosepticum]MCL6320666.1 LysR family transcriptional regulator [Pectobacterium atrosepticum]POW31297.1 LysR family transcriptional regulator [Pectobacterium atrosepticum]
MRRDEIADLTAFVVVAEERSFTKAALRLGMAQSALSQIVRRVEERLGLRLLARTTRSVAPTEAGERLLAKLGPMLHDLDTVIGSLGELRDRPSGTLRITTVEHAAKTILMPAMKRLLADNPDIHIEVSVDHALVDVVANQFDAGIRLGGEIDKDMIAMRIGPDIPMAIVASPAYLAMRPAPTTPAELIDHSIINFRLPTSGTLIGWRLMSGGREITVRGQGQLVVNTVDLLVDAVLDGHGLACIHLDQIQRFVDNGSLIQVLSQFTPDMPGYHLYYPNRRHHSSAFSLLVETLRYRT